MSKPSLQTENSLCLFFTWGVSLQEWRDKGLLEREVLIYQHLVKKGWRVAFLTYGDESDLQFQKDLPGIKIIPVYQSFKPWPTRIGKLLQSFFIPSQLSKELKQYSIYKSNQMKGAWVAALARIIHSKRFLLRCGYEYYRTSVLSHQNILKRGVLFLMSWILYRISDQIIVTSKSVKEYVVQTFKIPENKITVYFNLIETALFAPSLTSERKKRVLYVGRLNPEKNLTLLIQACAKLKVGLDLIGAGEEEALLKNLAKSLNADVQFLGVIPNLKLPEYMSQNEIFALPSQFEGNPKALLEAMSMGKAVVASNVPGCLELVQDQVTGLICDHTVESLSEKIGLLFQDEVLRKKLGDNARKFILENASLDAISKKEESLLNALI